MSQLRAVCDGCGELAPVDYSMSSPGAHGWLGLKVGDDQLDVCSWRCLARFAAEHEAAGTPITSVWGDLRAVTEQLEAEGRRLQGR